MAHAVTPAPNRWSIYLKERFPLVTYAILCAGFAAGGLAVSGHGPRAPGLEPGLSFLGLLMFFAELRLMDEYKDYHKDLIAHPGRPLPRGLITPAEVARIIPSGFGLMLAFGAAIAALLNPTAGLLYVGFTLYLWLMYKEFYVGQSLARSPLLYAITHQVITLPICLFTVAIAAPGEPSLAFSPQAVAYGVTVIGGFFAYEVCRKLDPKAHPVLGTYLSVYGAARTALIVLVLLSIAAYGSLGIGAQAWLLPVQAVFAFSVLAWTRKPSIYKLVEAIASVSLILHIWSAFIQSFLGGSP